jgi:hypothetical protein
MKYLDAFRTLAKHRRDEIIVTSAGNSGQAWWAATRDTEATFYLDASMSLSTMFSSGLALAQPELKIWAFMGDGAFCMNPGMLMVERQMNLPNLTHILVSNRVYGATSNAGLPNYKDNDYAAIARSMGLERVISQARCVATPAATPSLFWRSSRSRMPNRSWSSRHSTARNSSTGSAAISRNAAIAISSAIGFDGGNNDRGDPAERARRRRSARG